MLLLYRLLRGKKYRQARAKKFSAPPVPMRWRPKFKLYGLITGIVGGLGSVVLLAQYGIEPVTSRAFGIRGLIGGLTSGIVLPSLIFAFVVWRFNRKLRRRSPVPAPAVMLSLVVTGSLSFVILAAPAGAVVNGPCTAALGGVNAAGVETASASDAVEVPEDGQVTYFMSAPDELSTWRFWLEYGPYSYVIASGDEDPPNPNDLGLGLSGDDADDFLIDLSGLSNAPVVEGNTVRGAVLPSEFAWMGVGLYEVHGEVTTFGGASCDGSALIDVQGNPLTSILGVGAAATTAIGALGAAGVTIGGLRDGGEELSALEDWRKEELAAQDKFRRESLDAAEADWERRKVDIDAARAAEDAAMLAEIRAGRAAIENAETYLERREAILAALEASEARTGVPDDWDEWWQQVRDDAFDGMVRDVDSLPDFVAEAGAATRQRLGETWDTLRDPETWRVLGEAAAETAYDTTGLAAGGAWGDGAANVAESFNDAAEFGEKMAEAAANDPWGFVKQVTPLQAMEDAIDPDKPLGERLIAVGTATIDIAMTAAGGGALKGADALDGVTDTMRVAEAVDDVSDAARAAEAVDDARRAAWAEARRAGRQNVDDFAAAVSDGADDLREAALRVQSNKQALGQMKQLPDDVKAAFNREMRAVYDRTDAHVLGRVADDQGLGQLVRAPDLDRPNITVYRDPSGAVVEIFEPTNAKPGMVNVGADRDFAVYVQRPGGPRVSLPHDKVGDWYADGFYDAMGGDDMAARLGLPADKHAVLGRLDQAVTSDLHPEAYRNVRAVIEQPWAEIGDAAQVGQTSAFKADHLFERAEALRASDMAAAEDWMAEGSRQLTKQYGNQVLPRHEALVKQVDYLKAQGKLPAGFEIKPPPARLQEAMDVMNQVTRNGLSPADMERQLAAMGMTPRDVSRSMGEYLETMEKLRPGPVKDLARQMAESPDLVSQVMGP